MNSDENRSQKWNLVEGQDIRAQEGSVLVQDASRGWVIANKKGSNVYPLKHGDIIIGLVRPERRNIGILVSQGERMIGSPDGIAVIRIKPDEASKYSQEWLFSALRSEHCRIQFWTESGGTSYGKLSRQQILDVLLPDPGHSERKRVGASVNLWFEMLSQSAIAWNSIGTDRDRKTIINSPIFGLEFPGDESEEESVDLDEQ